MQHFIKKNIRKNFYCFHIYIILVFFQFALHTWPNFTRLKPEYLLLLCVQPQGLEKLLRLLLPSIISQMWNVKSPTTLKDMHQHWQNYQWLIIRQQVENIQRTMKAFDVNRLYTGAVHMEYHSSFWELLVFYCH